MKAKLFTLLTLLVMCVTGAWASTVDDLATISSNYTFSASTVNNGGALASGTLYDSNRILSVGGNGYNNGLQVKNNRQIAFKVSGACKVTITFNTKTGRSMQLGKTTTGTDYGSSESSPAVFNVSEAGVLYINASSDLYVTGFTVEFPSADAPNITKDPVSATYEVGAEATALSVTATSSEGTLYYEWYSNTTNSKENATKVQDKSTTVTYTPSIDLVGTTYYYCKVYDDNGSTDSELASVRVVYALAPTISYNDPTVTITNTGTGTVYYTTDGTVPTSTNGTEYTEPFDLTNSCTVRAAAIKSGNSSDLVKYDCYVDQSSAEGFLISTGNHSGTNSGSVWTSNDGNFTLSKLSGDFNWANHLFPGMHGHKMDNGITYTLQPTEDIKITSIKIVGRTWLSDGAATVAVDGATPSSETWLDGETGNVSYILAKSFTTSANYGEAVTITTTGNQFGCLVEVYGTKRTGPAEPEMNLAATWDFTSSSVGTVSSSASNTLTATTGSGKITYVAGSSCSRDNSEGIKAGGKTNGTTPNWTDRYFVLHIGSNGALGITSHSQMGEYIILQGTTSSISNAVQKTTITTATEDTEVTGNLSISDGEYVFIGFTDAKRYTKKITWTPTVETVTLTTTEEMEGWRTFYDASQGYTVDDNTKVFIASENSKDKVTLVEYEAGIPANTPVLLKTNAAAEANGTFKITLTKASVSGTPSSNAFHASTAGQNLGTVYRLGYGADGIAFYKYTTTNASAGIVYVENVTTAPEFLAFDFEDGEAGATNIADVRSKTEEVRGEFFDLQGRKVTNPTKGLYIVNGKKYAIK